MSNNNKLPKKSLEELTPEEIGFLAQKAVENAIARMHSKGIPTVEVDQQGVLYHRHPNGCLTPIERTQ